ncbi:MAG: hypothetical protein AAGF15_01320 [Pseudomonadota bacterium]
MSLLSEIESYLNETHIAPSRFGRDIVHDPRFVFDLRRGRSPSETMVERVRTAMRENARNPGQQ